MQDSVSSLVPLFSGSVWLSAMLLLEVWRAVKTKSAHETHALHPFVASCPSALPCTCLHCPAPFTAPTCPALPLLTCPVLHCPAPSTAPTCPAIAHLLCLPLHSDTAPTCPALTYLPCPALTCLPCTLLPCAYLLCPAPTCPAST